MAADFGAGCLGGAAGVIVGHPLDTVKVRLQMQTLANAKYRGTLHCLMTIGRQESIAGLYKGISSPLCGVAGVNAVIFGVYGLLRPFVTGAPGHDSLWAHAAAGSTAGAVQSVIAAPMELIKTRLQLDETRNKPSVWKVIRNIYTLEGGLCRGLFKGWAVTLAREIPGFGTYFATYEALTSKRGKEVGTLGMLVAGGMAGVVSWIACFPIDVIKTRLQSDTVGKYTGAVDCFKKTFQSEGYSAFARGLNSTLIRAFPTNAATFTVVTWIMRWVDEKKEDLDAIGRGKYLDHLWRDWNCGGVEDEVLANLRVKMPQYSFLSAHPPMIQGHASPFRSFYTTFATVNTYTLIKRRESESEHNKDPAFLLHHSFFLDDDNGRCRSSTSSDDDEYEDKVHEERVHNWRTRPLPNMSKSRSRRETAEEDQDEEAHKNVCMGKEKAAWVAAAGNEEGRTSDESSVMMARVPGKTNEGYSCTGEDLSLSKPSFSATVFLETWCSSLSQLVPLRNNWNLCNCPGDQCVCFW